MLKLWSARGDGDFSIRIGEQPPMLCHSVILYARWPYFRTMLSSCLRESAQKELNLPELAADGGMSSLVLTAILETCYLGKMTQETLKKFDVTSWLHLLRCSGLYLCSEGKQPADAPFVHLVNWAKISLERLVTPESCLRVVSAASSLGVAHMVPDAMRLVANNMKELWKNPPTKKVIEELDAHTRAELLTPFLNKICYL